MPHFDTECASCGTRWQSFYRTSCPDCDAREAGLPVPEPDGTWERSPGSVKVTNPEGTSFTGTPVQALGDHAVPSADALAPVVFDEDPGDDVPDLMVGECDCEPDERPDPDDTGWCRRCHGFVYG